MPNYAKENYTPAENELWEGIRAHEGELFHTVKGLTFTYHIRGNELFVDRKEKSITRATINLAFRRATAETEGLIGPKQLGTFGSSYLFPIFCRLGVLANQTKAEPPDSAKSDDADRSAANSEHRTGQRKNGRKT